MGRKCCVEGCPNHQKMNNKTTIFKVPRKKDVRQKWSQSLSCLFLDSKKYFVCQRHFHLSDITTRDVTYDSNGKVLYEYQYVRKRLKKAALPYKEPVALVRESLNDCIKLNDATRLNYFDKSLKNDVVSKVNTSKNYCKHTEFVKNVNKENNLADRCKVGNPDTCEIQPSVHKSSDSFERKQIKCELPQSEEPINFINVQVKLEENLYDSLLAQKESIKLPSSKWALHCCFDTQKLVFSDIQVLLDPDNCKNIIPKFPKQVIVDNDSQVQFKAMGKHFQLDGIASLPESLIDFEDFLTKVDELQICTGGPSAKFYKNICPEYAYKDDFVWRHHKCSIITYIGVTCHNCSSLSAHFTRKFSREKNIKCVEKVLSTPSTKNYINDTLNKYLITRSKAIAEAKKKK